MRNRIFSVFEAVYVTALAGYLWFYSPPFLSLHNDFEKIPFGNVFKILIILIFFSAFYLVKKGNLISFFLFFGGIIAIFNPRILYLFNPDGIHGIGGIYLSTALSGIVFFLLLKQFDFSCIRQYWSYLILLIVWIGFSAVLVSADIKQAVKEDFGLGLFVLFACVGFLLRKETDKNQIEKLMCFTTGCSMLYALLHFFLMHSGMLDSFRQTTVRAFGAFRNPNSLAAFLVMGFPFFMENSAVKQKNIRIFFSVLCAVCILLTGSRSGTAGFLTVLFFFFFMKIPKNIRVAAAVCFILLCGTVIWWMTVQDFQLRITGIMARFEIIKKGFLLYRENIFSGTGAGTLYVNALPYDNYYASYIPNIVLQWWFVYGIPGLTFMIVFFYAAIRRIVITYQRGGFEKAVSLSMAGILVVSMFENTVGAIFINWYFGIITGFLFYNKT